MSGLLPLWRKQPDCLAVQLCGWRQATGDEQLPLYLLPFGDWLDDGAHKHTPKEHLKKAPLYFHLVIFTQVILIECSTIRPVMYAVPTDHL